MLDSLYDEPSDLSVAATLAPGTGGSPVSLRVMDKTIGIEAEESGVLTIRPAAYLRMAELTDNSLTRDDLDEGTLTIGGKAWRIKAHLLRPNPDGQLAGEVCCFLLDEDA